MSFNPQSGITGSVNIGGTSYSFGKWTLSIKNNVQSVNNFNSAGFQQVVKGVTSADLTLEALTYDQGNMPFTVGQEYIFNLGYNALTFTAVTIMIDSIEPSVDYDGLQPIKITGKSDGAFTAAIV